MYIGIDPGVKGAIALLAGDGTLITAKVFPTFKELSKKGRKISRTDIPALICILEEIAYFGVPSMIMVEAPILMPGQNVSSTFNSGKSHGIILALLRVYFPDRQEVVVSCKEWQDEILQERTFVESKIRRDRRKQLKLDSIAKAQELFPAVDFKKSKKSNVDSDGIADALLIAHYCYKTYGKVSKA